MRPDLDPSGAARKRSTALAWAFGLMAATLVLYAPVFRFGFVRYDDPHYVLLNARMSRGLSWDNVRWALTAYEVGNWHPLTLIAHMADVSFFGMRAGWHHAVNAALHAANAALLFLFLDEATRRRWPSFAAAVLFAVHPLNVEAVAWISQRKSVLSMLFLLLALRAYVAWARYGRPWRYVLAVMACGAALGAKPSAVVLPVLLLLIDVWPLSRFDDEVQSRGRTMLRVLLEKAPFAALAAAASVATWAAQSESGAVGSLENHPVTTRLAHAVFAYAWYLFRMVWPSDLSLFYPMSLGSGAALKVAGSAIVLALITAGVINWSRTKPYLAFGWAWYAAALFPVVGFVNFGTQIVADRYAYLALIGPFTTLAFLGADLLEDRSVWARRSAAVLAMLVAVALSFGTGYALAPWRDSLTLLSRGVARAPDNVHAVANLGLELVKRERYDEGIALLTRAAAARPLYTTVHAYLGYAYAKTGRLAEARAAYETALLQQPDDAQVATELGQVLVQLRLNADAEATFRQAVTSDPQNGEAWLSLATLMNTEGRFAEAGPYLERAAGLLPGDARPATAWGVSLAALGRHAEAVAVLRKAVALDPDFAPARAELARIESEGSRP